jgi:hypothetical protein
MTQGPHPQISSTGDSHTRRTFLGRSAQGVGLAALASLLNPASLVAAPKWTGIVVENVFTVHDLHATMLHLFGIDHPRFRRKSRGFDAGMTGVEGPQVVKGILA